MGGAGEQRNSAHVCVMRTSDYGDAAALWQLNKELLEIVIGEEKERLEHNDLVFRVRLVVITVARNLRAVAAEGEEDGVVLGAAVAEPVEGLFHVDSRWILRGRIAVVEQHLDVGLVETLAEQNVLPDAGVIVTTFERRFGVLGVVDADTHGILASHG